MNRTALRLSTAAVAVLGLVLWLPAAAGAMVAPLTLQQLVDSSSAIVRVRVGSDSARAVGDGGRRIPMDTIVTDTRLSVARAYKGTKPRGFTLTQPGGVAEGYRLEIADVPDLTPGEEVVLFLDDRGIVGGTQGALRIVDGAVPQLGITLAELEHDIGEARSGELPAGDDPARAVLRGAVPATAPDGSSVVSPGAVSAAVTPDIGAISPSGANSGVGEQVTLTGANFGSTPGRVEFPRGDAISWLANRATVVSWSDTAVTVIVPENAQSGPVRLYRADGNATMHDYSVGYSYLGHLWAEKSMKYYINENTPDMTGEGAVIQRAMWTWNTCGADFQMAYAGKSSVSTIKYDSRGYPTTDGKNDIFFIASSMLPTGYLAVNQLWYRVENGVDTGEFLESNLMFSDTSWRWADGNAGGAIDLQTIALHELGHTVGLGDQYMSTQRVMGAYDGSIRRTLTPYELAGAVKIYGSSRLTLGTSAKLAPAYGKPGYVSVRLRDDLGRPITGQTVTLNLNGAPVSTLRGSVSDPGLYYGYAPVVKTKTLFWAYWAGDGTSSPGALAVMVRPKVKLSANAPESNRRYRKFKVKGTLAPAHSKAKVYFEVWKRKSSGSYYRYKKYSVTTSKGSFTTSMSLSAGTYRVRTTHADGGHTSSASSYDYFKVR